MHVRTEAGRAIASLHRDGFVKPLVKLVWGRDKAMSRIGLETMIALDRPECAGPLNSIATKHLSADYRRRAAVGLSNLSINQPARLEVVNQVMDLADDKDAKSRREAALILSRLRGPRFFVKLQQLTHDSDADVRVAAMDSLKRQMGIPVVFLEPTQHPPSSWQDETEWPRH
jgi:hypothetical protein